ncbi:restriction endonuclease subunit S [Mesorhizobium sp. BR1-1-13]|uniref:restriction endonuclease subunit S n=1 Tax=Mesorhizobium sp. BR1-1-13 TaxID=2876656 RepID=UPI001CD08D76|nr:restriction endonuclease subunit S [Mesorhizobium sp. BR1-1-13]MBZ9942639.1 restriction endonuclease subunit S [Mesorhizobium sp. BR1-1-13]
MLPEGWLATKLGDLVKIWGGVAPAALELRNEGPIPYLKVEDLNNSSKYQSLSRTYVARARRLVPADSILFPKRGAAISGNKVRIARVPHLIDSNMMALAADPKKMYFEYLYYLILNIGLFRIADTSTIPQINNKHIEPYSVILPPLAEQKKIADILSTWDAAMENAEKLLLNAEAHKRALMQKLLTGRRRLKAFEGREWKHLKLGSLFQERLERGGDALPLLSITGSRGVVPQEETDRRDTSREDKSSYKKICVGDIGYNTMRMWQGVSAWSGLEGLVSPAYTILVPGPHIDPLFASYLFKLPAQVHWFRRYSQGLTSDTWNLKYKQFAEVPAYVPNLEEQREIGKIISMAEQAVLLHTTSLEVLGSEKRALMQQLLSGKRRVTI